MQDSTIVNAAQYIPWAHFVWIVGGMAAAIVALSLYIKHLHQRYTKEQKETTGEVVKAIINNTHALEEIKEIHKDYKQMVLATVRKKH